MVFWAPHGDHAFLTVFAVFVVGMTVFAMESEEGVLDVSALMNYLRVVGRESSRNPGKTARLVVPRVADQEDVRGSGTMDGTL